VTGDCYARVYEGTSFNGNWKGTFTAGNYDYPQFTAKVENDQMSSLKVYKACTSHASSNDCPSEVCTWTGSSCTEPVDDTRRRRRRYWC
jgi:hypothetical protein